MALPRPREDRWRYLGALLFPMPCFPLLPPRGQSAVEFLLEGSRVLGCPKKNTLHRAPVVQGPSGSNWTADLGMDGRLLLERSGRVYVYVVVPGQLVVMMMM